MPDKVIVIEMEDFEPVPMTLDILYSYFHPSFMKWLVDSGVPVGPRNYPRLFAKFLEQIPK